ncbi:MAG: RpiB/LacA/LacB family sugar-phosphate isomerase [Bdellovibrionales bacterium]|nr:RpiB/LacA/LacB family sugar-phosphate isomerase [Bdellovibrionales bacterium]
MKQNKKPGKIFIANDHAGFPLKNFLIKNNPDQKWENLGVFDETISDYPEQAKILCRRILEDSSINEAVLFGVLICGSGQGMAIKANRFPGIRAALAWNKKSACLAREHNDANVLCLGARLLNFEDAHNIFKIFINTPFKGGRHLKRVKQLDVLP